MKLTTTKLAAISVFVFTLFVGFASPVVSGGDCYLLPPKIEVRVVDNTNTYTVDITTTGCGDLYSSSGGLYGWHMFTYDSPGTRTLRVPGSGAVDINYAPKKGRFYCFANKSSVVCSDPLDAWRPYKVYVPAVAK